MILRVIVQRQNEWLFASVPIEIQGDVRIVHWRLLFLGSSPETAVLITAVTIQGSVLWIKPDDLLQHLSRARR